MFCAFSVIRRTIASTVRKFYINYSEKMNSSLGSIYHTPTPTPTYAQIQKTFRSLLLLDPFSFTRQTQNNYPMKMYVIMLM